ncbi:MAG TPA: hypothetical protein VNA22_00905 [Pyrinomonadaceae bacterium]|nr:hypothetical protein [Pyrinomonadaceae bacterium]
MKLFSVLFASILCFSAVNVLGSSWMCALPHGAMQNSSKSVTPARRGGDVGIKEAIPNQVLGRYRKWKEELLSTEFGRTQWEYYARSKEFLLKIVISSDRKFGAGTDDFEWDENGKLVGATITLGKNLDRGLPDPVYYPVMNSLATYNGLYEISGEILASTKIIHEIGHVNFTAQTNSKVYQKQNKLMESYNSIFLKNGYNTSDERLVALATELGARPIEIWEEREYRSEVGAMKFLLERIKKESFFCSVYDRMRRNIVDHARSYRGQFDEVTEIAPSECRN